MTKTEMPGNGAQAALWNGAAGRGWAAAQALLDQMFQPFADLLTDELGAARCVLDIGCGAGATTLALAGRLGADGECTGVDISEVLIAAARARAVQMDSTARFVCADATAHEFAPGGFDLLVSRFGISFFADPARAFAHLRRAVRPGGALRFLTWRGPKENDFLTAAEQAAAPLLPALPPHDPDAPGPFALADERRIASLLTDGGWRGIRVTAADRQCSFPESGLMHYLRWMGPVGRMLQAADDESRACILDRLRPAFETFIRDGEVRFNAACWMIDAHASEATPD